MAGKITRSATKDDHAGSSADPLTFNYTSAIIADVDSDSSSVTSEDSHVSINSSFSFKKDMESVEKTLNTLKNSLKLFSVPTKGKPKKTTKNQMPEILAMINTMVELNTKLIATVTCLAVEVHQLKQKDEIDRRNYANVVASGQTSSPTPQIPTEPADRQEKRLEDLEQAALHTVFSLHGSGIQHITEYIETRPTQDELHSAVVNVINRHRVNTIDTSDIIEVKIVGKTTKHIKVTCINKRRRDTVVRSLKSARPDNIYINEYLTKNRSALFYQSRNLKKSCNSVKAVYIKNSCIYINIENKSKPYIVATLADLDKVKEVVN